MLKMTAELINVPFLFLVVVVLLFNEIKMCLAAIALCEKRAFPLQGPEMRGRQRADRARDERRRAARGNRPAVNQVNQRNGRRAEPQEHDERLC